MNKTILLAVDSASHTEAAAEMVRELASDSGDRVVVLHVHEYAVGRFGRIQVDCAEGEGERVAADIADRLRGFGVDATVDVRRTYIGHIAKEILAASGEVDARMIILGTGGTRDLPRLPFGSVSLRLLHMSDKPVLIVPRAVSSARDAVTPVAVMAR